MTAPLALALGDVTDGHRGGHLSAHDMEAPRQPGRSRKRRKRSSDTRGAFAEARVQVIMGEQWRRRVRT